MPTKFDGEEIAKFLSELIRIDTTNPPGNELEAAKLVAERLGELGISAEVVESAPSRGNVLASVGDGEPLVLLLSHLDVVPAGEGDWKYPPFSGKIAEGYVWGRGALDCKGLVATHVYALAALAREELEFRVLFAATADEEAGGRMGVGWLVENRPQALRAKYTLSEGGGFVFRRKRGYYCVVNTAEKGVFPFKLRFKGVQGHGSMPPIRGNALEEAARAVRELKRRKPPVVVTEEAKETLEALAGGLVSLFLSVPVLADLIIRWLASRDESSARLLNALVRDTVTPTMASAGVKINVTPPSCEVSFDCRVLPGRGRRDLEEYIASTLKGIDYELEFLFEEPSTRSPWDTPLRTAIEVVLTRRLGRVALKRMLSPWATDLRYLRRSFNSVAYGFFPLMAENLGELMRMAHGVNERISIRNLEWAARVTYEVVRELHDLELARRS